MTTDAVQPPSLLRLSAVKQRTGLSRSMLYLLVAQGKFPRQFPIGTRAVAWNSADVDQWTRERIAQGAAQSVVPSQGDASAPSARAHATKDR